MKAWYYVMWGPHYSDQQGGYKLLNGDEEGAVVEPRSPRGRIPLQREVSK
jgi:hypothetical protein